MVSAVVRAPPETCFHVRGLRWHHVAFHKVHAGIHWDQQGGPAAGAGPLVIGHRQALR